MKDTQILAQLICWVTMGELHVVYSSLPPCFPPEGPW